MACIRFPPILPRSTPGTVALAPSPKNGLANDNDGLLLGHPISGTPSRSAIGTGDITYWAPKFYSVTTKTGTVVVVRIINTVSNTTRISTIAKDVPPGFVPPPTNFGGTRTSKATYERGGTLLTTAV